MNETFRKLFRHERIPNIDKILDDVSCETDHVENVVETLDRNEEKRKKLINRMGTTWEDMIREPQR